MEGINRQFHAGFIAEVELRGLRLVRAAVRASICSCHRILQGGLQTNTTLAKKGFLELLRAIRGY